MKFTKLAVQLVLVASLLLSPVCTFATELSSTYEYQGYTKQLSKKINNIRLEQGLGSLATSSRLMQAAQMKAEDMVARGYFAHTSPDGISPWHWFYKADYKPRFAGENLALSFSLKADIVKHWLDSPSHKRNIMKENYTETGFGIAEGIYNGRKAYYIVELFGHL